MHHRLKRTLFWAVTCLCVLAVLADQSPPHKHPHLSPDATQEDQRKPKTENKLHRLLQDGVEDTAQELNPERNMREDATPETVESEHLLGQLSPQSEQQSPASAEDKLQQRLESELKQVREESERQVEEQSPAHKDEGGQSQGYPTLQEDAWESRPDQGEARGIHPPSDQRDNEKSIEEAAGLSTDDLEDKRVVEDNDIPPKSESQTSRTEEDDLHKHSEISRNEPVIQEHHKPKEEHIEMSAPQHKTSQVTEDGSEHTQEEIFRKETVSKEEYTDREPMPQMKEQTSDRLHLEREEDHQERLEDPNLGTPQSRPASPPETRVVDQELHKEAVGHAGEETEKVREKLGGDATQHEEEEEITKTSPEPDIESLEPGLDSKDDYETERGITDHQKEISQEETQEEYGHEVREEEKERNTEESVDESGPEQVQEEEVNHVYRFGQKEMEGQQYLYDSGEPTVEDSEGGSGEEEEEEEEEKMEEEVEKEPGKELYSEGIALVRKFDTKEKKRGYALLQQAAEEGNKKAKEELAYGYMFGNVLECNFTRSYEIFSELATEGDSVGQQGLGFMYSIGVGVNSSQAKGILFYTFAALGGHHYAQTSMGYRAHMGISVVQSCETALSYYYKAAKKVADEMTVITGGQAISKVRLMDEDNEATNVYGVSEDDMIHYHNVFADSGNTGAQLLLGVFYMYGMGGAERNFQTALQFLLQAAEEGMAAANTLIGKIYAEGSPEVHQDYTIAMKHFKKAADQKHPDGYSGLGMMYLHGMGVEHDYSKALEQFQLAADKGSAEGQYYLGYMHLYGLGTRKEPGKALRYFQLASHGGHLLAIYSLGEMHAEGVGAKRNCNYAVDLFKTVAERGRWTQLFTEAQKTYTAGNLNSALVMYLLLAEMGFEVAQSNAAYILEQEDVTIIAQNETLKRALVLWNRAAAQGYPQARVKLGDYYYYGHGTEVNYEAAAGQYRIASDKQSSAQAMFNLGYMYEHGLGLEKDYHLAKRYYDLAAETSSEALMPVNLALLKLNLLHYYSICQEYIQILELPSAIERLNSTFGDSWDFYLMSLLGGLIVLLVIWRRRH